MASLQLVRHATLLVELGGAWFLVDPMLDPAGARDAIPGTPAPRRNPLVELPVPAAEVVDRADAVLVTHLHADHFDSTAADVIGDRLPVFAQPGDGAPLRDRGVADVTEVEDTTSFRGVEIMRTHGEHGHGEWADKLGPVSGFVLRAPDAPVIYIAGDTVWCDEVAHAIDRHRPDVTVVNAGAARFLGSEPIVMDVDDVQRVVAAAPEATVVAVHMEAINHCLLTRDELRKAVEMPVATPADGEVIALP